MDYARAASATGVWNGGRRWWACAPGRSRPCLPATLTMGLLAGVFGVDSHRIMRGLTQDRRPDLRRRLPSHRRGHHQPCLHAHVRGRPGAHRYRRGSSTCETTIARCCPGWPIPVL